MKLISPIATKNLLRMLHIYVLHILNTSLCSPQWGMGCCHPTQPPTGNTWFA